MKTEKTVGISIQELIQQLQKIEKQNPNIQCVNNDQEYGIGDIKISIEKVFIGEDSKILTNKKTYENDLALIQEYGVENRMKIWNNLTEEDKQNQQEKDMFYSKDNFEKACNNIVEYSKQSSNEYEKSVDFLVIQLN